MKKFLVKMLTVAISVMMLASVFGCNKDTKPALSKAVAYDLVHGHYLGVVEMTVDKDGNVFDVEFDEVFFPYSWAKVNATEGSTNASFTDMWKTDTITTSYAKYIRIGDRYFEATGTISAANSVPVWKEIDGDIEDLEAELAEDADLQKWYYEEALKVSSMRIVKAVGDEFQDEKYGANHANLSLFKASSNYWRHTNGKINGMGWESNIAAMKNYLKTYGVNYTAGDLEDIEKENGTFFIGDVNTGATLTDFADYMAVAKAAYDKAMKVYA